jgi:hypothetical protein
MPPRGPNRNVGLLACLCEPKTEPRALAEGPCDAAGCHVSHWAVPRAAIARAVGHEPARVGQAECRPFSLSQFERLNRKPVCKGHLARILGILCPAPFAPWRTHDEATRFDDAKPILGVREQLTSRTVRAVAAQRRCGVEDSRCERVTKPLELCAAKRLSRLETVDGVPPARIVSALAERRVR